MTDAAGNTATCSFTVTVTDAEAPTALCQDITVQLDASGNAIITAAQIDNGSNDACGIASLSLDDTSFDCSDLDIPAFPEYGEVNVTHTGGIATYTITESDLINWGTFSGCGAVPTRPISSSGLEGWTWTDNLAAGTVVTSVEVNLSFDFSGTGATRPFFLNGVNEGTSPGPNDGINCASVVKTFTLPPTNYIVGGLNTFSWDFIPSTYVLIRGSVISSTGVPVVLTVTDNNGNVSNCNALVTVEDNIAPSALCQNLTIQLDASGNASITPAQVDNGSTDNCSVDNLSLDITAFACADVGANTVTLTVTDPSGNSSTCTATITVEDNIDPTITCPADVSVSTDAGVCEATGVNLGTPTTGDNCPGENASNDAPAAFPVGTTVVTWTVTDASGNTATCTQNVTVTDDEDPTITCPADVSVSADAGVCQATGVSLGTPTTSDNCPGESASNDAPASFPVGTTVVTWTVTDAAGNTATCTQNVTVTDDEDPTITCPADIMVNNDTGDCEAVVTYSVSSSDNCLEETIMQTAGLASGSAFPVGTTTNSFKVTDASGNTAICSFDVTVTDNEDPAITCPADITVNNDPGICGAVVNYSVPIGFDNCPGATTVLTAGLGNGATFPVGPTTETYTVTDAAGNSSTSCSFTVTVSDTEAPGGGGVTFPAPAPVLSNVAEANGYDFVYQLDIPNAANWDVQSQVPYAINNTAALSTAVYDRIAYYMELDGEWVWVSVPAFTTDITKTGIPTDLDFTGTFTDMNVFSNKAGIVTGTGIATGNIEFWDNCYSTGNLYAIPGANGGNYDFGDNNNFSADCYGSFQIHNYGAAQTLFAYNRWTAGANSDLGIGNSPSGHPDWTFRSNAATYSTKRVYVFVRTGGGFSCLNPTVALDASGNASITVSDIDNNNTDNCGIASISLDVTSFNCSNLGTNTVTLTATDVNGNVSTCTSTVTVEDNISPVINTPASDLTVECDGNGNTAQLNAWLASNGGASASDACGVTWSNDFTSLSDDCGATGSATVTFTATDPSGNSASTSATFTIADTTAPSIDIAASNQTVECDGAGNTAQLNAWLASNGGASASDICGIVTWSNDFTALSDLCGVTGNATVTFTATDECGNSSSTTATFTIEDTTVPVIYIAASDQTLECDGSGNIAEIQAWIDTQGGAMASDICGGITWTSDYTGLTDECGNTGEALVTFTATDDCGNASTTSATVRVVDTTPPSMTCPDDIAICADQVLITAVPVSWAVPMPEDICAGVSLSGTHNPGDVFPVGTTTVTYTAEDECGNTTTCSFNVTVYELPSVDITESELPLFCQGNAKILTANVVSNTGSITYEWSTGSTTDTVHVSTSGTYTVTVTDANGCQRSASIDVVVDPGGLLSAYTILATCEVTLKDHNEVVNGGVGVLCSICQTGDDDDDDDDDDDFNSQENKGKESKGNNSSSKKCKAKIEKNTFITGTTTFVQSIDIEVKSGSVVTTQVNLEPGVVLPDFLDNPFDSDNDVKIDKNQTAVLSDQVYGKVEVKEGATVTFTQKDLFIKDLKIGKDATIQFAGCTFLRLQKNLNIAKNVFFNPDGHSVNVYVDANVEVKEGADVIANIDARNHNINVNGKSSNVTFMTGRIIGRKVKGHKYVIWDWNTACDPECIPDPAPEFFSCECEGGMIEITFEYSGGTGASLSTNSGTIADNGDGTYTVSDGGDKLKKNLEISDGSSTAEIHTSCSKDILGVTFANDFTVIGYTDKEGNSSDLEHCDDDDVKHDLSKTKDVENSGTDAFIVYPNPTIHQLNLRFKSEFTTRGEITIYNTLGEKILKKSLEVKRGINEYKLDVKSLVPGTFMAKLQVNNERKIKRFVLIR